MLRKQSEEWAKLLQNSVDACEPDSAWFYVMQWRTMLRKGHASFAGDPEGQLQQAALGSSLYFSKKDTDLVQHFFTTIRAIDNPAAKSAASVPEFVQHLLEDFKHLVENQGVWRNFWNGGERLPERQCQLLFLTFALYRCATNDIAVEREPDTGLGPVDFKFTRGYSERVAVEVKRADSRHFDSGIKKQLPSYMKSQSIPTGWYMAIRYDDKDGRRLARLDSLSSGVKAAQGFDIATIVIDVRPKDSASKR